MQTSEDENQELALVELATQGDSAALDELLLQSLDRLMIHLNCKIPQEFRNNIQADDLVQETLRRAIQSICKFECLGKGSFFAWLRKISDNILFDELRKRNNERAVSQGTEDGDEAEYSDKAAFSNLISGFADIRRTTAGTAMHREMIDNVRDALAQLPEHYRQTIQLLEMEGLSYQAAAEKMGITLAAIRGNRQRALQMLRDILVRISLYL